jgi:two-component system, NarL family, response regulator DesR
MPCSCKTRSTPCVACSWEGNNPLTNQERKVLAAALPGISITEIARLLSLSEGTVRNHLSAAMQKVGVHNRMEAAHLAEQKGWL